VQAVATVVTQMSPASPQKLREGSWWLASIVVVGAIMLILYTTIVNVALATLSRELHATLSTIQWHGRGTHPARRSILRLLSRHVALPASGRICKETIGKYQRNLRQFLFVGLVELEFSN
jgi:hypothetical protein